MAKRLTYPIFKGIADRSDGVVTARTAVKPISICVESEKPELDVYSRDQIFLPDLIFTLHHAPEKHVRPKVAMREGFLRAVSNAAFAYAMRYAHQPDMLVDLSAEEDPATIRSMLEQFEFYVPEDPQKRSHIDRFFFIEPGISFPLFQRLQDIAQAVPTSTYSPGSCVRATFPVGRNREVLEQTFLEHAIGSPILRSVDGIRKAGYEKFLAPQER